MIGASVTGATMDTIAGAALVVGGLLTIAAGIWKIGNVVRRANHFFDDYFGEEPRSGVKARPGVQERLANVEAIVTRNGGTSLRDAVDRIEDLAHEGVAQGKANASEIAALRGQLEQQAEERDSIMGAIAQDRERWQEQMGVVVEPPEAWKRWIPGAGDQPEQ